MAVGKRRSSVYREIKRNFGHYEEYPITSGYWYMTAQSHAMERYQRPMAYITASGKRPLLRDESVADIDQSDFVLG